MSRPDSSATAQNGTPATTTSALSQSNISQVPRANHSSVDRFARASASEGPYYAGAAAAERSTHLAGLANQVNALDEIMKSRK
ncbi:hypothetical protein N7451_010053 [Penicillium sp. IBT 35674x]|nr:hypothetical protein N7451_010053 [Penicillium sp. IBT 35674x]